MTNSTKIINEITQKIEERACYDNPGPAAVESGKFIDENFVLIRRSDLPKVEISQYTGRGTTISINEATLGGDPGRMRRLAYQYLAMADFIDAKKDKEAEEKLNADRFRVFKQIMPDTSATILTFRWDNCFPSTQNAITRILELESQFDE